MILAGQYQKQILNGINEYCNSEHIDVEIFEGKRAEEQEINKNFILKVDNLINLKRINGLILTTSKFQNS